MDTADGRGKVTGSTYSIQKPNGQVAPPSASQMFFGERPPEARGTRNKIFSAGGVNNNRPPATGNDTEHPLYKSAQLAKPSKEQISNTQVAEISGSGSNFAEFYSPRPLNNDGTGELKTSKSNSPPHEGDFSGMGIVIWILFDLFLFSGS